MKEFFIEFPRTHKLFKQPSLFIGSKDGEVDVEVLSKPDNLLVCDVCNAELKTELIQCATFNGGRTIWGAYCLKCKEEYQPDLPTISLKAFNFVK